MQQEEKTVGVIGGMGPEATADFFGRIIRNTPARSDQDHLHVLIDNNPKVPNRNMAITGSGPSPAAQLVRSAKRLQTAGADFLVMPCNTAHAFADDIRSATDIPLLDIVEVASQYVSREFAGTKAAGVLATDGCRSARLYETVLGRAGIDCITLPDALQEDFMQLVYLIKATGATVQAGEQMHAMALELVSRGADVIVAGCTEVPLVLSAKSLPIPLIDTTEVLARRCVEYAREAQLLEKTG